MNPGRKYYFLTIAETMNITRAAEQLMVSQPSLTQYLNRLENELEIKLIDRSCTPLRLTRAGMLYRNYLRNEKALETEFEKELDILKYESRPPLKIGLLQQKNDDDLNAAFLKFCTDRPELNVHFSRETTLTVRKKLMTKDLDIGFGYIAGETPEDLISKAIRNERIVIVCNRKNPIVPADNGEDSSSSRVRPENLNDQIFYQMSDEFYLCKVELSHMAKYGADPKHRIVVSDLRGIIESILNNPHTGFAFVPEYALDLPGIKERKSELALLRLGDDDLEWSFSILRKKSTESSEDEKDFWNLIKRTFCQ